MKTIKLDMHIWARYDQFVKIFDFHAFSVGSESEFMKNEKYIYIAPYVIEIEMPKDLDLHKSALTALQTKRTLMLATNEINLNQIDAEISEFMAIENHG